MQPGEKQLGEMQLGEMQFGEMQLSLPLIFYVLYFMSPNPPS